MVTYNNWFTRFLSVVVYIPVLLLAVLMVTPYYWMCISAFKPVSELSAVPPKFYVEEPTLHNLYDQEVAESGTIPTGHVQGLFQRFNDDANSFKFNLRFFRFYFNSIFVSVSITIGTLLLGSLTAFVLAKHKFPGRSFFFVLFISAMMVPWQVMLIPGYLLVQDLNWISSFQGLIIPALPKAFVVFFLRQYLMAMPDEMLDAARIDGASELRIWVQIVLPLIRTALVAMAIFVFLGEWNNFVWPLLVMQERDMYTLPLALNLLNGTLTGAQNGGVMMIAALMTSLPTLIFFIIFQRQFVRGITLTGMKG